MTTRTRFSRLTQMVWEAAAVLAAILVAFGLDAWWGAHQERTAMLDALDAVAVEVERNLAAFDSASALNRRQIAVANDFVGKSLSEVESMSEEDILLYGGFPEYEVLTLERGALTAFIEGGFLQAVPDQDLRALVAGLSVLQDEMDEEREGIRDAEARLADATFRLVAVDDLLVESPVAVLHAYLRGIAGNEDARRAVQARAFALLLYTDEIDRLRDRLSIALEAIRRGLD